MTAEDLRRGDMLVDAGRHRDGLQIALRHLGTDPDDVHALTLAARATVDDDPEQALDFARRALQHGEHDLALRLAALALVASGRPDEAVGLADRSVRSRPGAWQGHYVLALSRLRAGHPEKAEYAALEAVRLAPDNADVHCLAGSVADAGGDRRRARERFAQALRIDPAHAVARHELGRMDLRRGSLAGAARAFSGAVTLDPQLSEGVWNLRLVFVRMLHWWAGLMLVGLRIVHLAKTIPAVAVPAVVTVLVLAGGGWFAWRAGRQTAPFVRSLWRIAPIVPAVAILDAVALVTMWTPVVVPTAGSGWSTVPVVCALAAFAGLFLAYRRLRRDAPGGRARR